MVGLQLRHRDHDVGAKDVDRQPQVGQRRKPAAERDAPHIRQIQVHEPDADVAQVVVQARAGQQVLHVPPMTGAFADDHFRGSCAQNGLGCSGNDGRVRIGCRPVVVLHEVRFQQHAAASKIDAELAERAANHVGEVHAVIGRRTQADGRAFWDGEIGGAIGAGSARAECDRRDQRAEEPPARDAKE